MKRREFGLGAAATATLALMGCSSGGIRVPAYHGPEVTSIVVNKSSRKMYLLHHNEILEEFKVDLGFAPDGDKKIRGDGKTPEGTYYIDRKNPRSQFHLSLGISYPNAQDVAEAKAMGKQPGGDIFIHGQPNKKRAKGQDWTAGCIAVKNKEIEQIWAMVQTGTTISLRA